MSNFKLIVIIELFYKKRRVFDTYVYKEREITEINFILVLIFFSLLILLGGYEHLLLYYAICDSWICHENNEFCVREMDLIWFVIFYGITIIRQPGWVVVIRFNAFFTSRAWHPTATRRRPTDGGEEKKKKAEGMRYTCGTSPRIVRGTKTPSFEDAGRTPKEC